MTPYARILSRAWMAVAICAFGYLAWSGHVRMQRVKYVSGLAGRANPVDVLDARSPTGYANGQRELIVPGRNEESFDWIAQTQQMLAQGELRVRRVDYENVPFGRDVGSASPYRWWLGLLALLDHSLSGRPLGLSVEHVALYGDPLLQLLLVTGAATVVAWRFGGFAAALVAMGLVGLFPFASAFVPGMPGQRGLAEICALGSLLTLLAGMVARPPDEGEQVAPVSDRGARPWFALAGVIGGLGMWVSVQTEAPILLGVFAGALVAARMPGPGVGGPPWRTWGLCGGWTVMVASLAEYFPGHLSSMRLESVNPLYGLAWLGGGALLARAVPRIRGERAPWPMREVMVAALAAACVAALPVAMWWKGSPGFLSKDLRWAQLTGLPDGPVAANSWEWLRRDGPTLGAWATLLPLAVLAPALWIAFRPATEARPRAAIATALGPVAVALAFACARLSFWGVLDAALLALIAAAASGDWGLGRIQGRWILAALVLAFAVPGIMRLAPQAFAGAATVLTPQESGELVDRHLAHWLAKRSGEPGMTVFAPPDETETLSFFGGLRGIGTYSPDNKAGFGNTLAIAGVRTMEEAQDLLEARRVRYIVMPSWDPFFADFARLYLVKGMANRPSFFANEFRHWNLPPWLQPVPYQMPVDGGLEGQSVIVLQVVDAQSPAAAAGRLAEYLVETGDLDGAGAAAERLRRFPGDVGALAARAQVQSARGEEGALAMTMDDLLARLSNKGDRYLPWDRRVSLSVVLARAQKFELSREQVRRCVADATEPRLRSLSTGSLFDLLVLSRSFRVEFTDPGMRDLALELLPGDLRSRL
jgi:hypothetical protein